MTFPRLLPALLLAVAGLLAAPRAAHAEATACQVVTLPVYINTPGRYCLDQDQAKDYGTFGIPLQIDSDDVVFDCNDHRIRNTVATTQNGIHVMHERKGVTIRDCVVENWYVGIFVQAASDPGSSGNRIEGNVAKGSQYAGIYLIGSHNLVEGNRVIGNTATSNAAYGIVISTMNNLAEGNVVRDNVIADFRPTPSGTSITVTGIDISNQRGIEVRGNVVSGLYTIDGNFTTAITGYHATNAVIADNSLTTPPTPWPAPYATGYAGYLVYLFGTAEEMATNICRDNVIGHGNSATYGCTAVNSTSF